MAVVKKKRSYNSKSARMAAAQQAQREQEQQKLHLQAKHYNEESRLSSETRINSTVHDESDSISFRSHLLKNFINSTSYINALTLTPVPLSRLQPASIYGPLKVMKQSITDMENKLNKELNQLKDLKLQLDSTIKDTTTYSEMPVKTILSTLDLNNLEELDFSSLESINNLLDKYKNKFNLKSQDYRVVKRINHFTELKLDKSEAPDNYWQIYKDLKQKQKERRELEIKLALEKKQKEEEEKQRKEKERLEALYTERQKKEQLERESKERLAREMEAKLAQEQDIIRQDQEQQQQQGVLPAPLPSAQIPTTVFSQDINPQINPNDMLPASIDDNPANTLLTVGDNTTGVNGNDPTNTVIEPSEGQELLDDMFGQYNNEQFNNGFDDGFDDLDNVFF